MNSIENQPSPPLAVILAPEFKELHATRLRKLIRHLLNGKLAHKKFDFRVVNYDGGESCVTDHCGTAGCALGEFHHVFPTHFRNRFYIGCDREVLSFLSITEKESRHLFVPGMQLAGTPPLAGDASRTEVAANMIQFLRSKGFRYND